MFPKKANCADVCGLCKSASVGTSKWSTLQSFNDENVFFLWLSNNPISCFFLQFLVVGAAVAVSVARQRVFDENSNHLNDNDNIMNDGIGAMIFQYSAEE